MYMQNTRFARTGRNGCRRRRRRSSRRCSNDGFLLFDGWCDRRDIDVIMIVINFDHLRRRTEMFRKVEIRILSSFVGKLGPVNAVRRRRVVVEIIITRGRGVT